MKHLRRPRRQYRLLDPIQTLEPRTLLSYSISSTPAVVLNTSLGEVVVQLDSNTPISDANFLSYVTAGSYSGTVFHRIAINGQTQINNQTEPYSIVQGGGYTNNNGTFTPISTHDPITNEAITSGNSNTVGTIAMARTTGADSATSQFFFNVTDNSSYFDPEPSGTTASAVAGYAVFGTVIRGLGIVDTIDGLNPTTVGNFTNVPELNTGTTGASPFVTINTATQESVMTVTMGPNDAAGTHSVTFHDATNNASTTISLSGANSTLTFTGTNLSARQFKGNLFVSGTGVQLTELASSNTTAKSNLIFSSSGRNKHVDIGDIAITGSLHNISGSGINLTGDIDISGGLNQVKLLSSTAAGFLSIDSNSVTGAPATTINIPFLSNISIQTGASIKELIARQYSVSDGTNRAVDAAGDIQKVLVYGVMNAGVNGNSVGSYKAGELTSYVAGQTTVGNVQVSVFQQGEIYSGGAFNAKTIGIRNVKISGAMDGGEIIAAGNIGSVHAASMVDATIVAGYDTTGSLTAIAGFQTALASNAFIQSVSLRSPKGRNAVSFNDSQIQANEIGSLHLGRIATTVSSSASLPVMGVQTSDLKSLIASTDQNQSLHLSNIKSQAQLSTVLANNGVNLNPGIIVDTLGAALTSGTAYTSLTLKSKLTASIAAGTTLNLVSGNKFQTVTLAAAAAVNDTTLSVTSFTANANFPPATPLKQIGSGFLIDIIPPVTASS